MSVTKSNGQVINADSKFQEKNEDGRRCFVSNNGTMKILTTVIGENYSLEIIKNEQAPIRISCQNNELMEVVGEYMLHNALQDILMSNI